MGGGVGPAYLHRVEGDLSNARYWYRQAGRAPATAPLEREWQEIAGALLSCAAVMSNIAFAPRDRPHGDVPPGKYAAIATGA
jgi:hypothetical protein